MKDSFLRRDCPSAPRAAADFVALTARPESRALSRTRATQVFSSLLDFALLTASMDVDEGKVSSFAIARFDRHDVLVVFTAHF